jgi:OPA family glycerol-3-phosphate transporter-like MFS transporter
LGAGACNLLVYFLSGNYIAMLIIWSINAILQFGIWPAIFKIITSQLCTEHRSKAIFYISFSSILGLVLSYACAAIISDWRVNFLLSAIVLFACTAIFGIVYHMISDYMTDDVVAQSTTNEKPKQKKEAILMVIRSGVPLLLIVYVIHGFLNLGLKTLSPVMMIENYPEISPSLANALNIILILAGPVGLFFSRLSVFKKMSEPYVMALMFGIAVPALLVITFVGQVHLAVIIAVLAILMVATGLMSVFFSYVSKAFEKFGYGATIAGLFNCMAAVGIVLANYVFTKIADKFGWGVTTKLWLVIAIASLILCLIVIPIWGRFKRAMKTE